ncbi:MAG: Hsp20 family protein [bacterium]|nr:Hsp20 family protein [bacterium]
MAKIKQKINITEAEADKIRRQWDIQRGRWYFSVTDVIAVLTESVDARNYWKALKSRLKSSHNQLVMNCNQLKMTASDGKSYLVDVADADTLERIIQIIAPHNVPPFRSWFEHIEMANSPNTKNSKISSQTFTDVRPRYEEEPPRHEDEISTDIEIPVDVFEKNNQIIVKVLAPGFNENSLLVSASMDTLFLKGSIQPPSGSNKVSEENYFHKELNSGEFYREIKLTSFVDVDNFEAIEFHGLVTITLNKIDLKKTRFIKVKSLES